MISRAAQTHLAGRVFETPGLLTDESFNNNFLLLCRYAMLLFSRWFSD